ncbi:MAG: GspH/FimT family pseudopilin [Magnetococcales bacterium]|nr:GspH/FimT family pseudopilin [Magnetococcales bacterium]
MGKDGGFSLIELLLVMVLSAIVFVVAAPRWPGDEITLQSQADQLSADLDLARALAISRGESITIQRATTPDSYTLTDSSGTPLYPSTQLDGISLQTFSITFDPYGNPGSADQEIALSHHDARMSLRVVGESGVVIWL